MDYSLYRQCHYTKWQSENCTVLSASYETVVVLTFTYLWAVRGHLCAKRVCGGSENDLTQSVLPFYQVVLGGEFRSLALVARSLVARSLVARSLIHLLGTHKHSCWKKKRKEPEFNDALNYLLHEIQGTTLGFCFVFPVSETELRVSHIGGKPLGNCSPSPEDSAQALSYS